LELVVAVENAVGLKQSRTTQEMVAAGATTLFQDAPYSLCWRWWWRCYQFVPAGDNRMELGQVVEDLADNTPGVLTMSSRNNKHW
jgi:hypothetical protein